MTDTVVGRLQTLNLPSRSTSYYNKVKVFTLYTAQFKQEKKGDFLPSRPLLIPLPRLLDPPRPRLASLSPAFFSLTSFTSAVPPSLPRLRFFPTVSQEV